MKRVLFILIILLSACSDEVINENFINNNIRDEMLNDVDSFLVEETFNLSQYGDTLEVALDNKIEYDSGVFSTTNSMIVSEDYQTKQDYEFSTYVNVFNDIGYIKDKNSTWYEVELSQMYKLKMGSIDPLSIVNSVLFDTKKQMYKNIDQFTGPLTEADRIVSVLDRSVFETMFASSIFNFVEPLPKPYDYTVTATLKFDESYKIEYIEFDLSDFKDKYEDYHTYELKSDITNLNMDLRLDFDNYDEVNIDFDNEVTNWIVDSSVVPELKTDEIKDNFKIGDVDADVIYNPDNNKYETTVSLNLNEDVKYLSFEIFYLSDGKLIEPPTYRNEYDFEAFETRFIDFRTTTEKIEHIYFKMRYVPKNKSSIISVSEKIDFNLVGPALESELDLTKFDDTPVDVIPNILVEYDSVGKDQKKIYDVSVMLYSKDNIRNGTITLYIYDQDKRKPRAVIRETDIVIDNLDNYTFSGEIDFMPDDIYVELSYNTSYLRAYEQFMHVDFKKIEGVKFSNDYKQTEDVNVTITEWSDSTWMQNKYHFQFRFKDNKDELNAYIYFLNDRYEVIGWEFLYDFNITKDYLFVSDLYSHVESIYIDLELKGEIFEKYHILGNINTNTN